MHPLPPPRPRYEAYLDAQITGADMYFLEDVELARQLVELGWVAAWGLQVVLL